MSLLDLKEIGEELKEIHHLTARNNIIGALSVQRLSHIQENSNWENLVTEWNILAFSPHPEAISTLRTLAQLLIDKKPSSEFEKFVLGHFAQNRPCLEKCLEYELVPPFNFRKTFEDVWKKKQEQTNPREPRADPDRRIEPTDNTVSQAVDSAKDEQQPGSGKNGHASEVVPVNSIPQKPANPGKTKGTDEKSRHPSGHKPVTKPPSLRTLAPAPTTKITSVSGAAMPVHGTQYYSSCIQALSELSTNLPARGSTMVIPASGAAHAPKRLREHSVPEGVQAKRWSPEVPHLMPHLPSGSSRSLPYENRPPPPFNNNQHPYVPPQPDCQRANLCSVSGQPLQPSNTMNPCPVNVNAGGMPNNRFMPNDIQQCPTANINHYGKNFTGGHGNGNWNNQDNSRGDEAHATSISSLPPDMASEILRIVPELQWFQPTLLEEPYFRDTLKFCICTTCHLIYPHEVPNTQRDLHATIPHHQLFPFSLIKPHGEKLKCGTCRDKYKKVTTFQVIESFICHQRNHTENFNAANEMLPSPPLISPTNASVPNHLPQHLQNSSRVSPYCNQMPPMVQQPSPGIHHQVQSNPQYPAQYQQNHMPPASAPHTQWAGPHQPPQSRINHSFNMVSGGSVSFPAQGTNMHCTAQSSTAACAMNRNDPQRSNVINQRQCVDQNMRQEHSKGARQVTNQRPSVDQNIRQEHSKGARQVTNHRPSVDQNIRQEHSQAVRQNQPSHVTNQGEPVTDRMLDTASQRLRAMLTGDDTSNPYINAINQTLQRKLPICDKSSKPRARSASHHGVNPNKPSTYPGPSSYMRPDQITHVHRHEKILPTQQCGQTHQSSNCQPHAAPPLHGTRRHSSDAGTVCNLPNDSRPTSTNVPSPHKTVDPPRDQNGAAPTMPNSTSDHSVANTSANSSETSVHPNHQHLPAEVPSWLDQAIDPSKIINIMPEVPSTCHMDDDTPGSPHTSRIQANEQPCENTPTSEQPLQRRNDPVPSDTTPGDNSGVKVENPSRRRRHSDLFIDLLEELQSQPVDDNSGPQHSSVLTSEPEPALVTEFGPQRSSVLMPEPEPALVTEFGPQLSPVLMPEPEPALVTESGPQHSPVLMPEPEPALVTSPAPEPSARVAEPETVAQITVLKAEATAQIDIPEPNAAPHIRVPEPDVAAPVKAAEPEVEVPVRVPQPEVLAQPDVSEHEVVSSPDTEVVVETSVPEPTMVVDMSSFNNQPYTTSASLDETTLMRSSYLNRSTEDDIIASLFVNGKTDYLPLPTSPDKEQPALTTPKNCFKLEELYGTAGSAASWYGENEEGSTSPASTVGYGSPQVQNPKPAYNPSCEDISDGEESRGSVRGSSVPLTDENCVPSKSPSAAVNEHSPTQSFVTLNTNFYSGLTRQSDVRNQNSETRTPISQPEVVDISDDEDDVIVCSQYKLYQID